MTITDDEECNSSNLAALRTAELKALVHALESSGTSVDGDSGRKQMIDALQTLIGDYVQPQVSATP